MTPLICILPLLGFSSPEQLGWPNKMAVLHASKTMDFYIYVNNRVEAVASLSLTTLING